MRTLHLPENAIVLEAYSDMLRNLGRAQEAEVLHREALHLHAAMSLIAASTGSNSSAGHEKSVSTLWLYYTPMWHELEFARDLFKSGQRTASAAFSLWHAGHRVTMNHGTILLRLFRGMSGRRQRTSRVFRLC